MTNLQISPATLVNGVLLIISIVTFIFAYNKAIKERVNKSDLTDLKEYVDQQDRSLHHRVDETNGRIDNAIERVEKKLDLILSKMLK